jgi:hypothetical protein
MFVAVFWGRVIVSMDCCTWVFDVWAIYLLSLLSALVIALLSDEIKLQIPSDSDVVILASRRRVS